MVQGIATQQLWLCTWGTMAALVWAQDAPSAELRVAHDCFRRAASLSEVTRSPQVRHEPITVRLATEQDKANFEEWRGKVAG